MVWTTVSDPPPALPALNYECQEFEEFCRAIPGVLKVRFMDGGKHPCYAVTFPMRDHNPIQRRIYRWLDERGLCHAMCFMHPSHNSTAHIPSPYDPLDRAISNPKYIHRPDA
jgi:hypothetical protein